MPHVITYEASTCFHQAVRLWASLWAALQLIPIPPKSSSGRDFMVLMGHPWGLDHPWGGGSQSSLAGFVGGLELMMWRKSCNLLVLMIAETGGCAGYSGTGDPMVPSQAFYPVQTAGIEGLQMTFQGSRITIQTKKIKRQSVLDSTWTGTKITDGICWLPSGVYWKCPGLESTVKTRERTLSRSFSRFVSWSSRIPVEFPQRERACGESWISKTTFSCAVLSNLCVSIPLAAQSVSSIQLVTALLTFCLACPVWEGPFLSWGLKQAVHQDDG